MQYSDESQLTDEAASDAFTGTLLKLFNIFFFSHSYMLLLVNEVAVMFQGT